MYSCDWHFQILRGLTFFFLAVHYKQANKQTKNTPTPTPQKNSHRCAWVCQYTLTFSIFFKVKIINWIVTLKSFSITFSSNLKTDCFLKFFHFLTQDFLEHVKIFCQNHQAKTHLKIILMIKIVFMLFYKSQYPVQWQTSRFITKLISQDYRSL